MNILVLSINYSPEPTGFAPHVAGLCEYLASRGNHVTTLTGFPFAPYWKRWPQYRGRFISRQLINRVEVLRLSHFIPRRPGKMIQRLLMEGTFCLMAAWVSLIRGFRRRDLILYVGAQPSIAMLARLMARWRGSPYVVMITDLSSQAAREVGIVKAKWLEELLSSFEYAAYHHADGAVVLCLAFRERLIAHNYPADHVRIIPSPIDVDLIHPVAGDHVFRKEHSLSDEDFVVLYSGSMGLKQGLTNVIEAARRLKDEDPAIKWVLVGNGELKPRLQKLVSDYDLAKHVHFLPLQAEEKMSVMFSSADVLLLNQLTSIRDTVIPSKLLTYMAAGRAVILAVNPESQAAAAMRKAQGGLWVRPEDPIALAEGIKQLKKERHRLEVMGQLNRHYAEQNFDRKRILAEQEAFLLEIVIKNRPMK